MKCPSCNSHDVARRARRNPWDNLKASMGLWPYLCQACDKRFSAGQRYPSQQEPPSSPDRSEPESRSASGGPGVAYRSDAVRPIAKVVIEADDHVQLDQILMALNRAVSYYQQPSREKASSSSRS